MKSCKRVSTCIVRGLYRKILTESFFNGNAFYCEPMFMYFSFDKVVCGGVGLGKETTAVCICSDVFAVGKIWIKLQNQYYE